MASPMNIKQTKLGILALSLLFLATQTPGVKNLVNYILSFGITIPIMEGGIKITIGFVLAAVLVGLAAWIHFKRR